VKPTASVQVMDSGMPTFRIYSQAGRAVAYTLTAHDSSSSVTQLGKVAISNGQALVTTNLTISGRTPDVINLTLRDVPGSAATFFTKPLAQITDATLFEAHRIGKSAIAFDELVRRHEARVSRIVERIVGNKADAEDVRQFVFLELSRFQNSFSQGMTGWLNTVSRNAALTFLRTRRRRLHHEQAAARSVSIEPATPFGLDETLAAAIQQLPSELGQAVRLRYVEGYTQEEAAQIVGVPRGTLSRRASSGLQVLRQRLTLDRSA
jgi:RNA polymerase sigma-70 factor, ECF subfamily